MATATGVRVRVLKDTRADLRVPGSDIPKNGSVAAGQEYTVSSDTADALIQTGSAVLVGKNQPSKAPPPPPPKAKTPGRMSRPRD